MNGFRATFSHKHLLCGFSVAEKFQNEHHMWTTDKFIQSKIGSFWDGILLSADFPCEVSGSF